MSKYVIGIDPGVRGAMAVVDLKTKQLVEVQDMPWVNDPVLGRKRPSAPELEQFFSQYAHTCDRVVIEHVHSMPRMRVQSIFSFGFNVGYLHAMLDAFFFTKVMVDPAVWKLSYGLSNEKRHSIQAANKYFPGTVFFTKEKHDGRAEAALLAHIGMNL